MMIMTRIQLLTLAGGLMLACTGCAQTTALVQQLPLGQNHRKRQEIQYDLARLSEKQGKLQQAQRMFEELVRANPNDANSFHRLGVIAAKLGQTQDANGYFMAALRTKPHDSEILTDFGYSLYLQNDLAAAETALRQARTEDVNNERALNNLAMVVGTQGRTDESFALFRQIVSEAEATSNVAYIQARAGDVDHATQSYSEALTLNSDLNKASIALLQIAERGYVNRQRAADNANMAAAPQTSPAPETAQGDYFARQRAAYQAKLEAAPQQTSPAPETVERDHFARHRAADNANLAAAPPTPPARAPLERERPVFAEELPQPASPHILQTTSSTSVRVMLDDLPVQPAVVNEETGYDDIPVLESIETLP